MIVIKFIKDYWYIILPSVEILCTILLLVLRKKPVKVVDSLKGFISSVLPALISEAEDKYPVTHSGIEKRKYVLESCKKLIGDVFPGVEVSPEIIAFVLAQVEAILSTPTKKGVR